MSADRYAQRSSWRQQKKSKNPWVARILFTLMGVLLLGWFLYIILKPQPHRELKAVLVHAVSFDSGVIMPPMFAETARATIDRELEQIGSALVGEIRGEKASVLDQLKSSLQQPLQDKDDTVMVIVRGYLLADPQGEPAIACSDLSPGDNDSGPTGLLPVAKILEELAAEGPDSFSGTRLVVLDIEPLASQPRLGQYADDVFGRLENVVKNLDQRFADRLWVLVTRGPLQNVGWDAKTQMPISTQTLLDAITGDADFDANREIRLDEVCRYMGSRYRLLAQRGAPQVMLFRGTIGRVDDVTSASDSWIVKARPAESAEEAETDPESDPQSEPPESTGEGGDTTAFHTRSGIRITPVRFQAEDLGDNQASTDASKQTGQARQGEPNTSEADAAEPSTAGQDATVGEDPTDSKDSTQPVQDPSNADAKPPAPDDFWTIRDRLESPSSRALGPIAVAPHLWRKLVQEVLHAGVEAMDRRGVGTRSQSPALALRDLTALEQSIQSYKTRGAVGRVSFEMETVGRMFELWSEAMNEPSRQAVNSQVQVQAADHLQQMITVGRMRLWNQHLFQQQAIICGNDSLVGDANLAETLHAAEARLAAQEGFDVDDRELRSLVDQIGRSVRNLDESVGRRIDALIDDFGRIQLDDSDRVQMGTAWSTIRRAHAWLRSPLPTAQQRRQLQLAIDDVAGRGVATETVDGRENPRWAGTEPDIALRDRVDVVRDEYLELAEAEAIGDDGTTPEDVSKYWKRLSGVLANQGAGFAERFAAALRIDPYDTDVEDQSPIIHRVLARPRVPRPRVSILDAAEDPVQREIGLRTFNDHLYLEIAPDASHDTTFRVGARLGGSSPGQAPIELEWQRTRGVERTTDPLVIRVSIPAGKSERVRLNIRATRHASASLANVPIQVGIAPIDVDGAPGSEADAHLATLRETKSLRIVLPQQDRIRAVVKAVGMSKEFTSGDDLSDGVWLRTFVSRKTRFSVALFNDAGRSCRARAWLIRLRHPFPQEADEYWPDILARKTEKLRQQLIAGNDQVDVDILRGDQRLKGPVTLEFGADRVRTALKWDAAEAADSGSAPPPAAAVGSASVGSASSRLPDVSHGLALVIRLLDSSDNPLPGGDQIIWMVPRPWLPEDYVDVDEKSITYSSGEVKVAARLKREIDGDQEADTIPENEKSVILKWTEDDQWAGFRPGATDQLDSYSLDLNRGGQIEVPVPKNRPETIVRLDVDGWPRAIKRSVLHREGAMGNKPTVWNSIQFTSVTMDYGEKPPKRANDDLPLDAVITRVYPERVVFRGRGKSLRLRLGADFSKGAYDDPSSPPRIQLREGNKVLQTYWTDRSIQTVANALADNGRIDLTTTVSDLEVQRTEAERRNEDLRYVAELTPGGGGSPTRTSLLVTLDYSPPRVTELRTRRGPYYVGQPIEWNISFTDPVNNGTRSSVTKILVGLDKDQDDKPDGDRLVDVSGDNIRKTFTPEKAGMFRVAAQVWDEAGLTSDPLSETIEVRERPKPKPKTDPKSTGKGKPATEKVIPPRGKITGRIDTRSTLRGTLKLSPAPSEMRPADGRISVSGANPSFDFRNVPSGEYTLSFQGTVNGSTKPYTWKGLKIDVAGGKPFLSLSPRDAE